MILASTPENISRAAGILQRGGLVAFPTETVYGLGADASNPDAVAKIFAAKGRPQNHPVIVHLADFAQLADWARDIPESARTLAAKFWPGPLTMILPRAPGVPDAVTGGQDSVGVRVPGHPVAQQFLRAFGGGIAAPSANRFGRISPTQASHVASEFGDAVEFILDGGACEVGIESTIIDLSRGSPVLLRPGRIGRMALSVALSADVVRAGEHATRAPGMLESHYAPATPLEVLDAEALNSRLAPDVAVLAMTPPPHDFPQAHWIIASANPQTYARELYAILRRLDAMHCRLLLVEQPPAEDSWMAVNDRLTRAARSA